MKKFALLFIICLVSCCRLSAQAVSDKIAFSRQESGDDWDIWIMDLNGGNEIRLLNSSYKDYDPHFRNDGRKIVFGRSTGSPPAITEDIYVMNSDGSEVTNLTSDAANEVTRPKWSWDGTKIVYNYSAGPDNLDIYVMNADGTVKTAVVTGSNNDCWASFSPDGSSITFQRYVGAISNQKSKICTCNLSTHAITELTDGSELDEMPVYSPDGNYIIFKRGSSSPEIYKIKLSDLSLTALTKNAVVDDAPMYSYDGTKIAWIQSSSGMSTAEIWIMNSDGTSKTQLTDNSVADFNPTFSPFTEPAQAVYDKIAFTRMQDTGDWDIWIMDRDGTDELKLVDNLYRDTNPHFNPQGTKIVFARITSEMPMQSDIYVMNSDGGGETNLTGIASLSNACVGPHFSWDGTKIAFDYNASPGNSDIWIMDADGTGHQAVVASSEDDTNPAFSPDGQWLVYQRKVASVTDPKSKICKASISTGEVVELTDGNYLDETPVFSADGNNILFKRGFTQWDLYLMSSGHNPSNNSDLINLTNEPTTAKGTANYSWEGDKIVYYVATAGQETADIYTMNTNGTGKTRITNNSAADWDPSFSPSSTPVPVEMVSFSAKFDLGKTILNWRTATEVNNYGFEVQRSQPETDQPKDEAFSNQQSANAAADSRKLNADSWEKIGFVGGSGNSNSIKEYTFTDKNISSGKYYYRLKQIDNNGAFKYSNEIETEINIPLRFAIDQNYPNPFNPTTAISYQLSADSYVVLKVYDILGREVKTLVNENMKAGYHTINFDASSAGGGFSSGIYIYKIIAGNYSDVKKMLLLK